LLNITELAVLGFAAARATQLGVHDSILDPVRERLELWAAGNPEGYWRGFWRQLFGCVYCLGWWLSGAVLLAYLMASGQLDGEPLVMLGVDWLAVAGIQMMVNRRDDTWGESR
jgi:uncharacterized membrane protein